MLMQSIQDTGRAYPNCAHLISKACGNFIGQLSSYHNADRGVELHPSISKKKNKARVSNHEIA